MACPISARRCTGVEHIIESYAERPSSRAGFEQIRQAGRAAVPRPSQCPACPLPAGLQDHTADVARQILPVDNSGARDLCPKLRIFFSAQPVERVLAGQTSEGGTDWAASTASPPSHAQDLRRVCTGCPQSCAQPDWTYGWVRRTLCQSHSIERC